MSRLPGVAIAAGLPLMLAAGLGLSACQLGAPDQRETEPDSDAGLRLPEAEAEGPRLVLSAEPVQGEAPLRVRFIAELLGDEAALADLGCPTLAWTLDARDDGQVVIAQAEGCLEQGRRILAPRRFELEHTYAQPRAYEVSLRLIARDLPPSNLVQILVAGPTATPGARGALPGPTIVVATPAALAEGPTPEASQPSSETEDRGAEEGGEPPDAADRESRAGTSESPDAAGDRLGRVLPADLYYLAGSPKRLFRLPASGGRPELLSAEDGGFETYALSAQMQLAFAGSGGLTLGAMGGGSRAITSSRASDLVWSRDGRRLAMSLEGRVWHLNLRDRRLQDGNLAGRPLAWSRDGGRLLAKRDAGGLALIDPEADAEAPVLLPIEGVEAAGALPDRDALWLSGAGLQLLELGANFRLRPLVGAEQTIGSVFPRPDGHLLYLQQQSEGRLPRSVDLSESGPEAELDDPVYGALLGLEDEGLDWDWAPDGRLAALAGVEGLVLLDVRTGVRVPLISEAASQPRWLLARRAR